MDERPPAAKKVEDVRGDRGPTQSRAEHFDLPPVTKERSVDIPRLHLQEELVTVPHIQYIERIEEVKTKKVESKTVAVPRVEVTERVIEIPKHMKDQAIVEVPQVQVIDKIVEVPQYVIQEKIVEVPKIVLQERIIPIPKRTIEEKIVEVPEAEFEQVLRERVESPGPPPTYGRGELQQYQQVDDAHYMRHDEPLFDVNGNPLLGPDGRQLVRRARLAGEQPPFHEQRWGRRYSEQGQPIGEGWLQPGDITDAQQARRAVGEVVEIPHVQHIYRNVMQPLYRHVPKPVEVPLTHYKPHPVERVVDRHIPIPVELEVIQEFKCPRLQPKYTDTPVVIPVQRIIEVPVPVDAMFNSVLMDAYISGMEPQVQKCTQICGPRGPPPKKLNRMTEDRLRQGGVLPSQLTMSQVKQFHSRLGTFEAFNVISRERWMDT